MSALTPSVIARRPQPMSRAILIDPAPRREGVPGVAESTNLGSASSCLEPQIFTVAWGIRMSLTLEEQLVKPARSTVFDPITQFGSEPTSSSNTSTTRSVCFQGSNKLPKGPTDPWVMLRHRNPHPTSLELLPARLLTASKRDAVVVVKTFLGRCLTVPSVRRGPST